MSRYEIYSLLLCFIVLAVLTVLFTVMISLITKYQIRLIRHGAEDEKIIKEYAAAQKRAEKQRGSWISNVIFALFFGVFFIVFALSVFAKVTEKNPIENLPSLKVVRTSSMEEKYQGNKYLFENNLNDQIATFDLIVTHKLPGEFELKLYDIVVYEVENTLIVHRIVGIEEPNEKHPNERYFLLQGDNLESADRFPVHYSQMKAIYRGERVPFVGSFVLFMQTPAGWVCVLLVLLEMISMPAVEKKLESEKEKRIAIIQSEKKAVSACEGIYQCATCPYNGAVRAVAHQCESCRYNEYCSQTQKAVCGARK